MKRIFMIIVEKLVIGLSVVMYVNDVKGSIFVQCL